jgi:hypothetical protein
LFLPEDTDGALALHFEEGLRCAGCGQPGDESRQPSAEEDYRTRRIACHACAELEKARADLHEGGAPGIHLIVERTRKGGR